MANLRSSGLPVMFDPEPEWTIRWNTASRHSREVALMTSNLNSPRARGDVVQYDGTPTSKGGVYIVNPENITLEEL